MRSCHKTFLADVIDARKRFWRAWDSQVLFAFIGLMQSYNLVNLLKYTGTRDLAPSCICQTWLHFVALARPDGSVEVPSSAAGQARVHTNWMHR